MYTTHLRKVGGSIMLTIPPALLDILHLQPGSTVGVAVNKNCLVVKPQSKPRYSLEELLSQCDPKAEITPEDTKWVNSKAVGKELL